MEADAYLQAERERLFVWTEQYVDLEAETVRLKWLSESIAQIDAERKLLEQEETLMKWKEIYALISKEG